MVVAVTKLQTALEESNNNKAKVYLTVLPAVGINIIGKANWCLDTGATEKSFFVDMKEHKENIYLAGEQRLNAKAE